MDENEVLGLRKAEPNASAQFDDLLLLFMISADLLFRAVENTFFIVLCELMIKSSNKYFAIPKRRSLKTLLTKKAAMKRNDIRIILSKVSYVAISTDCWSSTRKKIGFLGVTVHYFTNFSTRSLSLGVKRIEGAHTADNLVNYLNYILEFYNIREKVQKKENNFFLEYSTFYHRLSLLLFVVTMPQQWALWPKKWVSRLFGALHTCWIWLFGMLWTSLKLMSRVICELIF